MIENLDKAISQIQKQFGKEAIFQIGQERKDVEVIPTGSFLLDAALGVGGIPQGRIVEIYGPNGAGKTTLALNIICEAQKLKRQVAFIDTEHSLSLEYAESVGVNVEKMWVSQPDCGEEALEIVDALTRSNEFSLIVVDSVAALTPKAEIEGEMGQSHMGLQARLMSQALRKFTAITAKSNCVILFINQIRSQIGVYYGSPEVTTGGNALKFYSSIRLEIRMRKKIEDTNKNIIGQRVVIKVVKNKVAAPFKQIETYIIFGKGIDRASELLDYYVEKGKIEKMGSWFKIGEEKFQGKLNVLEYIRNNINNFEVEKT